MAGATVLVVDDEAIVLDLFTQTLAMSGYEVLAAESPEQALEIVRNHAPIDAVLSDVTMPGMSGTDLVRQIARESPTTACVLVSGYVVDSAELPSGVPVLHKPLLLPDLIAAVEEAISRSMQLRSRVRQSIQRSAASRQESKEIRAECEIVRQKSEADVTRSRFNRELRKRPKDLEP